MFCPNCGIEIKNPEAFCPNCGTPLGKVKTAMVEENTKTKQLAGNANDTEAGHEKISGVEHKAPKRKKSEFPKIILLIPVVIIAVVLIYTKFFGKTVIDLNKYYTITVTGVNGDGELDIVFEEDKFREKYQNVLKYDEKQVRKEVEKEYGDEGEDYIDLAMESLESYEPVEIAIESI